MKLLLKRSGILALLFLAFGFLGCEDDDEGNALPEVVAQFVFELNEATGTVSFTNLSENADDFEWDFGNGASSTEINPIVTYETGTYTVTLTASNTAGASDTFEDELVIVVPGPITLPITFDDVNVEYGAIAGDNIGFSIVTNPETGNGNTTNVGQMITGGGQFQNVQFPLGTPVDFSGDNKAIQLELFSSVQIAVLVKFENGAGGARDVEVLTTHTGSGWETLNFDFATDAVASFIEGDPLNGQPLVPDGQYGTMILFVGFNTDPGVEGTFLVDNIAQTASMGGGGDMPTVAAPTPPTRDAADVISLFSNAYTNIAVDTFFAGFSQGGGQTEEQVAGDDVLLYADLDFAGIETITETVDLSAMTDFHIDVWTATEFDLITGVVDFAGDGFDGGNDTRGDARNTLSAGQWTSIDVTIADLQAAGLTATPADFSQLILDVVDVTGTVYVDNIYFYNEGSGGGDTPSEAAPIPPTRDAADVISLFSNAYTNITVDTFFAGFSQGGGQTNEQVAGDDVLLYTDLDFAGIETISETVDLSSMTNFHIDVWTATGFDFISGIVDFAGDGFDGGNDTRGDTRNTLMPGQWNSIDITIADLQAAGLTATPTDFSQLILDVVDVTGTVYVDNIYFYNDGSSGGGGDAPTMAAPTPPSRDAADVISLFSNAYSNITVDTFYAGFSLGGGQTNEQVAGDDVLLYTDLDFAGIETITETVDLSSMTNFYIDVWTATEVDLIAGVVDFAGDGFDGGNDTRGDTRNTLMAGQWTSIDVTIADLQAAGLTATPMDFSQLILDVVDVTGTIYVDNIYFYNDGSSGGGGDAPTMAAPTPPSRDSADIISLFSNAYSNITVDTFYAGFSLGAGLTNEQVAGDDVLVYTDLDFAGIETLTTTVDLSSMTNFHIDVWTATEFDFIAGVVDFAGDGFDGGNDTRGDTRNTLMAGQWTSIDVTIADLQAAGLTVTPTDFSQLILDIVDVIGTVYVDNIYFYR